jgi:hypothetical protein
MTIRAQRHPGLTTPATITNTVEFDMDEYGPFNDCTLMVVGGLRTAIPLALSGYQQ